MEDTNNIKLIIEKANKSMERLKKINEKAEKFADDNHEYLLALTKYLEENKNKDSENK